MCALGVMLAALAPPASAKLTLMHGYADTTSAIIWIMADAPGPIDVSWRVEGAAHEQTLRLDATATNGHTVVARLTALLPGQAASYQVRGDHDRQEGSVRAQVQSPAAADAPTFTLAIGSCFFLAGANPPKGKGDYGGGFEIFEAIAAAAPDAMLWLGDNLYLQPPDFADPGSMAARYRRQRTFPPLRGLLTATAHVAIWDDHDYGPNNANATYRLKDETLALFQRYWPNPEFGLPDAPGVFGRVSYGDIDVFLLDDRWYRTPDRAPEGPQKTMFGTAQLRWLRAALLASRAPVKLIAGGSQFLNRANRHEGWNHFAQEQKAFLDFLHEKRIDGVIFLSGDRHFTELLRVARPDAYPLHEFTSSPLTSRPWKTPDRAEIENPDIVPGTLVGKRQFGLIRATGSGATRQLTLESRDASGALLWRHEIAVRDLTYGLR